MPQRKVAETTASKAFRKWTATYVALEMQRVPRDLAGGLRPPHYFAMLTIIGSYVSPYVRKVLACMNLKNLDYEVDPITPFFGNDEFRRLSPLCRIPVLIDDEFSISDSSVICAYLDDTYRGHPLFPASPRDRARARWLEEFADTRLGDLLIWSLFYQKEVRPLVWNEPPDDGRIATALEEEIPAALDYLESEFPRDGFLFGQIGVADIAIASFFQNGVYAGFSIDESRWPRTAGLVERTLAHSCLSLLRPYEDVQRSVDIKGRRQALRDAGAKLAAETLGVRAPRKGVMQL